MSNKTLITVLFITMLVCVIIFVSFNQVNSESDSYKYGVVNTTNEEIVEISEETKEEKSNKENNFNEQRTNGSTVSRNLENDRRIVAENAKKEVSENSPAEIKFVGNFSEKIVLKEEFVEGVRIVTYNNVTYDLYSNGDKKITKSIESVEFDNSQYTGSTKTLKNKAKENVQVYSQRIQEVYNLTNQYRNEVNLNNLVLDEELCVAASVRALEMAYTEKLSHTRPDGAKCFVVLKDLNINYVCAGENIGDGFKYSENVCKAWKDSESHYKNIVGQKYNKIGIGVAQSLSGKYYWVQIFSN